MEQPGCLSGAVRIQFFPQQGWLENLHVDQLPRDRWCPYSSSQYSVYHRHTPVLKLVSLAGKHKLVKTNFLFISMVISSFLSSFLSFFSFIFFLVSWIKKKNACHVCLSNGTPLDSPSTKSVCTFITGFLSQTTGRKKLNLYPSMLKNITFEVEATAADYNLTINVTLPSKTQKSLVVFSDHGITQLWKQNLCPCVAQPSF